MLNKILRFVKSHWTTYPQTNKILRFFYYKSVNWNWDLNRVEFLRILTAVFALIQWQQHLVTLVAKMGILVMPQSLSLRRAILRSCSSAFWDLATLSLTPDRPCRSSSRIRRRAGPGWRPRTSGWGWRRSPRTAPARQGSPCEALKQEEKVLDTCAIRELC